MMPSVEMAIEGVEMAIEGVEMAIEGEAARCGGAPASTRRTKDV
jgi:hypothetical protein